ncbi:MAG: YdcF family protein [Sandaracinaceae bacterium]|nr:YdcF family protein [Sandaracinaceae bacterium]
MGRPALALIVCLAGCASPLGRELFVHGAPLRRADAIVVLGNRPSRTSEGGIAPELDRRVQRGVELFDEGLAPLLVLVGAAPEAEAMLERARALGVSEAAVRVDGTSRDTADNAREAVRLVCEGRPRCEPRMIVVSSPYHLRRAAQLFRCAGVDPQVAASPLPDDLAWQASRAAYEYGVRLAYVIDDPCSRARPRH